MQLGQYSCLRQAQDGLALSDLLLQKITKKVVPELKKQASELVNLNKDLRELYQDEVALKLYSNLSDAKVYGTLNHEGKKNQSLKQAKKLLALHPEVAESDVALKIAQYFSDLSCTKEAGILATLVSKLPKKSENSFSTSSDGSD